jgi:hypothetical protein
LPLCRQSQNLANSAFGVAVFTYHFRAFRSAVLPVAASILEYVGLKTDAI